MKSTILKIAFVLLMVAASVSSYAQCDQIVILKSSKTNFLDDKGNITHTKDEQTDITITKSYITIIPSEDAHTMSGEISSKTCEWKTPFKVGKTAFKVLLKDDSGNEQHGSITITGVDGKITLTYQAEERPGVTIMLTADKFEEKKG